MTDLSEDWFFAGWLVNLEYILWSVACGDGKCKSIDYHHLCEHYGKQLKSQAEAENKWYYWSNRSKSIEEMRLDVWVRKYKRNSSKVL